MLVNIYAFDVDYTLEISNGPVTFQSLCDLRQQSHILGLCGNWGLITGCVTGWDKLFSFVGPIGVSKTAFLLQIRQYCPGLEYVFVGNDRHESAPVQDRSEAYSAGWRFLLESEFASGIR